MKQKKEVLCGNHCVIDNNSSIGINVTIGHNCVIEEGVIIGDNTHIDSNTIIRKNVTIGKNSFIGSNCILGEYWTDYCMNHQDYELQLLIGENALIRSGSIIYVGSNIGSHFQTGHQVTIRERSNIGDHVSVGTLSDIQGNCLIGNYVRLHSNVHVGQLSKIDDFVWVFPYVILTNDPTPPSEDLAGVHIKSFAIIAARALILPGVIINNDSLVAAGAVVTKDVEAYEVVAGNPAKVISDVRSIKNKKTGASVYPWRYHFNRAMPWCDSDFETWYMSLDICERNKYCIDEMV